MVNLSSQTAESSTNQSGEDMTINSASGNPSSSATTFSKFLKDVMNPTEAKSIGRLKGSTSAEAKSFAARVEIATKEAVVELEKTNKSKSVKKMINQRLT